MKQTILIDPALRSEVYERILEDRQVLGFVQIASLHQYMFPNLPDTLERLADALTALAPVSPSLKVIGDALQQLDHLRALIRLTDALALLAIPLQALPEHTQKQREMKIALRTIGLPEVRTLHDASDVLIMPMLCSAIDTKVMQQLMQKGAQRQTLDTPKQNTRFMRGLNRSMELHGVCQELVRTKQNEAVIVLADYPTDIASAVHILRQYHLSARPLVAWQKDPAAQRMSVLLQWMANPCLNTLKQVLLLNVWGLSDPGALIRYLTLFPGDAEDLKQPLGGLGSLASYALIEAQDKQMIQTLTETAERVRKQMLPYLSIPDTLTEQILRAYEQIRGVDKVALGQFLSSYLSLFSHHPQGRALLMDQLATMMCPPSEMGGILLCDATHIPVHPEVPCYIIGAEEGIFPNYPAMGGLVDEGYLAKIPGYPSVADRLSCVDVQLETLLGHYRAVTYSYALSDFSGKHHESAYFIERIRKQQAQHFSSWSLLFAKEKQLPPHRLSPEMAQQLFVRDGVLRGSISAFETYRKNPYKYFLHYGLGLREPFSLALDARMAGTLLHAYLEKAMRQQPLIVPSQADLFVDVERQLAASRMRFPERSGYFRVLAWDLSMTLHQTMAFLKALSQHFGVKFLVSEHSFQHEPVANDPRFALNGKIDRIDASDEGLVILDYKSSRMELKRSEFQSGLKLQLLTYAMMAQREYQQPILGAYYIPMIRPKLSLPEWQYDGKQVIQMTEAQYQQQWIKARQLKGWTFTDEALVDVPTYMQGAKARKDGAISYRKEVRYDFSLLCDALNLLYAQIRDDLLAGIIDWPSLTPPRSGLHNLTESIVQGKTEIINRIPELFPDKEETEDME